MDVFGGTRIVGRSAGLLAALFLMGCVRSPVVSDGSRQARTPPTTVIILRHAERLSDEKDSPLSEVGKARAHALVPLLTAMQPDLVVVSELQRTRQTAAPFLDRVHRASVVRSNEKCAELAAEILKDWRGKTVLVVWHRGPNEDLARALGAKEPFPRWAHDTYDRYWVITITAGGEVALVEKTQPPVKELELSPISR